MFPQPESSKSRYTIELTLLQHVCRVEISYQTRGCRKVHTVFELKFEVNIRLQNHCTLSENSSILRSRIKVSGMLLQDHVRQVK